MSLRMKLYAGFAVMIAIALVMNLLALRAFSVTGDNVESTSLAADTTANECTPINIEAFTLATNMVDAGSGLYGYSINHLEDMFAEAKRDFDKVEEAVRNMDAILAAIPSDHLPITRKNLPILKEKMQAFEINALALNASIREMLTVRQNMAKDVRDVDDVLKISYRTILDNLKALNLEEANAEDTAFLATRLSFINSLSVNTMAAMSGFWHAQAVHNLDEARAADAMAADMIRESIVSINNYRDAGYVRTEAAAKNFESIQKGFERFVASMEKCKDLNEEIITHAEATVQGYQEINAIVSEITSGTTALLIREVDVVQEGMHSIRRTIDTYGSFLLAGSLIALLAGAAISVCLVRNITKPINTIIAALSDGADAIKEASSQIASASSTLAEGATTQAASLEETSSALEQMASMTRQNADNAAKTQETTAHAGKVVEEGAAAMVNMTQAMADINERSEKISNIVKTIEDIAFQTNLLALNAAVEAARAGEAGKGFAVVADEVRSLSQRSAQAAKDTTELITGSVNSVHRGTEIANELTASFSEIQSEMKEVIALIAGISSATQEQASGVDQVNTAVAQMDKVTQQNAAESEQTASASGHLDTQAEQLSEEIGRLLALVHGGNGNGNGHNGGMRRGIGGAPAPKRKRLLANTMHEPSSRQGDARKPQVDPPMKVVAASEVIPLEEDHGDF